MEQETRICQNYKQPFVIEPDNFAFYGKIGVPADAKLHSNSGVEALRVRFTEFASTQMRPVPLETT